MLNLVCLIIICLKCSIVIWPLKTKSITARYLIFDLAPYYISKPNKAFCIWKLKSDKYVLTSVGIIAVRFMEINGLVTVHVPESCFQRALLYSQIIRPIFTNSIHPPKQHWTELTSNVVQIPKLLLRLFTMWTCDDLAYCCCVKG